MNHSKADSLTGDIATVGGCTVGAVLLGGSIAGETGALFGTLLGVVIGIAIVRGWRRRSK